MREAIAHQLGLSIDGFVIELVTLPRWSASCRPPCWWGVLPATYFAKWVGWRRTQDRSIGIVR